MTRVLHGERIGKTGVILLSCSAVIFDSTRQKVLLTRRKDNGQWCLPSGRMEPGESVTEACARGVWEETGLHVRVGRLIGVYSSPNRLTQYADGNRFHIVALNLGRTDRWIVGPQRRNDRLWLFCPGRNRETGRAGTSP